MKALANYVLRHHRNAATVAFITTFLPLLGWIGASVMALITLRQGALAGIRVMIWIIVARALQAYLIHSSEMLTNQLNALLLLWGMALSLYYQGSWRQVILLACSYGVGMVAVEHLLHPDFIEYWTAVLAHNTTQLQNLGWQNPLDAQQTQIAMQQFAKFASGIKAILLIGSSLFSLLLARQAQALLFNPGGLKRELYQFNLHKIALLLPLLAGLSMMVDVDLGRDMMIPAVLPLVLLGWAVLHILAAHTRHSQLWLGVLYGALIVFSLSFLQSLGLLLIIGITDIWVNYRSRILAQPIS